MFGSQPYQTVSRLNGTCLYPVGMLTCEFYRNYTMKVKGEGSVSAEPDQATFVVGVTNENKSLETAQQENAERITSVIRSLTGLGIPRENIQTQSYQVQPQYDFVEGRQVFRGYQVTHNLKVELDNIGMTGRVIDTAVKAGANTVGAIEFSVKNPSAYYKKALDEAITDAASKAAVIGAKLNTAVSQLPVQIVEETYQNKVPVPYALQSAGATTPIMPGQIEITAAIEAIFAYGRPVVN